MFARTERLMLRPGWIEDAPALSRAIGREDVVLNLARAPWPYALGDAEAYLSRDRHEGEADMLIFERGTGAPTLIGGVGLASDGDAIELGYWIVPSRWGHGFATEAARAVVAMARDSLRVTRLVSGHFADNPASGRVLRKLGFQPTGEVIERSSKARGHAAPMVNYVLNLGTMALAA